MLQSIELSIWSTDCKHLIERLWYLRIPYGRGQTMFDFLSIAGRCKKSHRLVAYIVGCITLITILVMLLVCTDKWLTDLNQYREVSINLLSLIEIKISR